MVMWLLRYGITRKLIYNISKNVRNTGTYVRDAKHLEELCCIARQSGRIMLDTEFVMDRTQRPKLCLVQIGIDSETPKLLDPFRISLNALQELMIDGNVTKVFHDGSIDLPLLCPDAPPKNIFDTQIAASIIGMYWQTGYATLLKNLLGVKLDKAMQCSNWKARPLSASQEQYALNDVIHLFDVHDALQTRLKV